MKKPFIYLLTAGFAISMIANTSVTYASTNLDTEASVNFYIPEDYEYPIAEPLDPTNPDNESYEPIPGAGEKQTIRGALSIDYASNISFGDQEISLESLRIPSETKTPFVQVTDQSFSESGWTLTAELKNFGISTENETSNVTTLNGSSIQFSGTTANAKALNKLNIDSPDVAPEFSLEAGGGSKNIAKAETEDNRESPEKAQGLGTWIITWLSGNNGQDEKNENVLLNVPAASVTEGNHTAQLDWVLTTGPQALSSN